MNKRTLTTGALACALGIVAAFAGLGDRSTASIAAAAKPSPMFDHDLDRPPPTTSTTPTLPRPEVREDRIQIALLIDTSSHMEGFIDEARSQLWKVVDEYARATRDGRHARLEIALF